MTAAYHHAYPRPNGRGPIEAHRAHDLGVRCIPPIRDLTVAAPLKRHCLRVARVAVSTSTTVAAPLKPSDLFHLSAT